MSTRRFAFLAVIAFAVLFTYELVRSPVDAAFVFAEGAEALPATWIVVSFTAALVVSAYDRLARQVSLVRLFVGVSLAVAALFTVLTAAVDRRVPFAAYGLYALKDVYVVVLLEMVWSLASLVTSAEHAKRRYGLILAAGSLGGVAGGAVVGVAPSPGVLAALMLVATGVVVGAFGPPLFDAEVMLRRADGARAPTARPMDDGAPLLRRGSLLRALLALVVSVQAATTLIDYLFAASVRATFPTEVEATRALGLVASAMNLGALALQGLSPLLLVRLGPRLTLVLVPAALSVVLTATALHPTFALFAAAKIANKAMDYSVFKAAKETMYIPLTYAEKTRGKALVDVFGYRVAKGGASALLGALVFAAGNAAAAVGLAVVMSAWFGSTLRVVRRHARLADEAAPRKTGEEP